MGRRREGGRQSKWDVEEIAELLKGLDSKYNDCLMKCSTRIA
jgi:hypothetical protein